MLLQSPFFIGSNLLPALRVGQAVISMQYGDWTSDGRISYDYVIEHPEFIYGSNDLASGVGGGTLQQGFESLLSFLLACAESLQYFDRTGTEGENQWLFPPMCWDWVRENSDELQMLQCDLEQGEFITE